MFEFEALKLKATIKIYTGKFMNIIKYKSASKVQRLQTSHAYGLAALALWIHGHDHLTTCTLEL